MNTEINYTSLIEKGLVKKSLSDTDIIPVGVYDKTKSGKRKQSGIVGKTLKTDILSNVTDVVNSLNTQTGDLELATVNGSSLLQNTDFTASDSVTYANVFFVDPVNGNNTTALVNRFDKPYASYSVASAAALALAPTQTTPALVVLRKGTYVDNMLLRPYVYVKCDKGVVFTFGGFYDDINTVYCRVYGKACFYVNGRPIAQTNASNIHIEFDKADMEMTTPLSAVISNYSGVGNATLSVVCNSIDTNGANALVVSLRYGVVANMHVKDYIQGPRRPITTIFMSGTIKIYCPKIIATNRTPYSAANPHNKLCVYQQGATSTGLLEIYGDLYNISNNFTYSPGSSGQQCCLASIQCATGATTRVYGNIYGNETYGIYTVFASGTDGMFYDIKGNISSKSIPVCLLGTTNKLKIEGEITKLLNDAIAAPCIYATNSCEIYAKNTHLKNYNTVNSNVVALDAATAKGYFYNCTAYTLGTGDVFLKDTSTGVLGCVNTKGNVPLGAVGATAAFSPQDYTQVTGATVPNF